MATWKITLSGVGPEMAGGTIFVEAQDLVKAKLHAIRECRKHLPAGSIYLEARGNYTYSIILDMDEMGELELTRLDACPSAARQTRETRKHESPKDLASLPFARPRRDV